MRTLKDRLSHLSFTQACKLLGPRGKALILEGGKFDIDLTDQVTLDEDYFRLTLGTVRVEFSLNSAKKSAWICTAVPATVLARTKAQPSR
jgi:hypothetical protein